MPCWVVPAIAAELWGVTVNHVLAGIRDGSVATREEHGFVFVDVAPGGYTFQRALRPDEPRPPTFVLSRTAEDDELPTLDEEEDATPLPPRDAIRAAVARRRRPPVAA